ncbi:hypothetical protein AJ87_15660 [Rhizobium yanglingense]|nr:hypothetical protein AJ87_15660 [Rhizobium yanglingense]
MTDTAEKIDYSKTLYLPETDFPMRAGLPQKEPEIVARWQQMGLYRKLRDPLPDARSSSSMTARPMQRQHPYRPRAEQDPQGRHQPLVPDARL